MTTLHGSRRSSSSTPCDAVVLSAWMVGILLGGLLTLNPRSASATQIDPCSPAGSRSPSPPPPAGAGYLIIQLARDGLEGRAIFVEGRPSGHLPRSGQCIWLPLAPGQHTIRIQGLPNPIPPIEIASKLTTFYRLDDTTSPSRQLPRFAVWLSGVAGDFPAELPGQLLLLASRADSSLQLFDLADELSDPQPQIEDAVQARLARRPRVCAPRSYTEDPTLTYLLILSRSTTGYRVRAFHTSFGGSQPIAELDEASAAAAECRDRSGPAALQCLMLQTLNLADSRAVACLQVAAQPGDAQVVLTPLRDPPGPEAAPRRLQLNPDGTLGLPLFVGASDAMKYRLSVEHPRFLPQERVLDFNGQPLRSIDIRLQPRPQPRPVPATPLYKKWWLWQSVATAVVVGVTGTVAGIYSGDRGSR